MKLQHKPKIAVLDHDPATLTALWGWLEKAGYEVGLHSDASAFLETARREVPALVLVEHHLPEADGLTLCRTLRSEQSTHAMAIVVMSPSGEIRLHALEAGAAGFLEKPLVRKAVVRTVRLALASIETPASAPVVTPSGSETPENRPFEGFLNYCSTLPDAPAALLKAIPSLIPDTLYQWAEQEPEDQRWLAGRIAGYLGLPFEESAHALRLQPGVLPAAFCSRHGVAPVMNGKGGMFFLLANPFQLDLMDTLRRTAADGAPSLRLADPRLIETFLDPGKRSEARWIEAAAETVTRATTSRKIHIGDSGSTPMLRAADRILEAAVEKRASDIHIAPKEEATLVRLRVDGDLQDFVSVNKSVGDMLISRYKAMGGLDIAERRRPQDGSLEAAIGERSFKLRMATSSTPQGESMVLRLLEPESKPKSLNALGMLEEQAAAMQELSHRTQGMVLLVGPTGSGKTTTIYSFLSGIDCRTRSLLTVEDPVEYRIPDANQQEVREKAGVTFESLLRSAVRQDPDILFLGEVRDPYSARMAVDFAASGHLTISTLHSSTAVTALFRLERLGISRGDMADSVIAVIAQRLIKRLCPHCKQVGPPTAQELEWLEPHARRPIERVARPVGCAQCNGTGFRGREGVYEILALDNVMREMVRSGESLQAIRRAMAARGTPLMANHAIEKVIALTADPLDVRNRILGEEEAPEIETVAPAVQSASPTIAAQPSPLAFPSAPKNDRRAILVVEDEAVARKQLERLLQKDYEVVTASDGFEALLALGNRSIDLVVSDIQMPGLDGIRLLEVIQQKNLSVPVMFLTGSDAAEMEASALAMGAVEFIHKPFSPEVLRLRIRRLLGPGTAAPVLPVVASSGA